MLRHHCVSCPRNFLFADEFQSRLSSSCSRVFLCDVCHCTRAHEEKMLRHLRNDSHCSASEYLSDSATMTLHQCVRRSSLKLNEKPTELFDSIIVKNTSSRSNSSRLSFVQICPFCDETFSSVNACAMHSYLRHSAEFVYSVGFASQTFDFVVHRRAEHVPELKQTKRTLSFYFCSIDECFHRTKDFFAFRTHLISTHGDAVFHPSNETLKVKIQEFPRPETFLHITPFHQKNRRDIEEELRALEQLDRNVERRAELLKTLL